MSVDKDLKRQVFNLRAIPWWTDGCSTFLSNVFKWMPHLVGRKLTALEFGGGNSTFYLLGKGLKVATIESDDDYIEFIRNIAENIGHKAKIVTSGKFDETLFSDFDLLIIRARNIQETDNIIGKSDWDFIIDDGVSRREVLQDIHSTSKQTVIILDNIEYCANWGRLDRTSAKPDLIKAYRSILRDKNWRHYVFEQPEGRDGRGSVDKHGWESPHRWASAILWPEAHLFAKLIVSNIGMPIVNAQGTDDSDTDTLNQRCPFDWSEMKWLKSTFPIELDMKLLRSYD